MKVTHVLSLLGLALLSQTASATLDMKTDPSSGDVFFKFPRETTNKEARVDVAWKLPAEYTKEDGTTGSFDLKKIAAEDEDYIRDNAYAIIDNSTNVIIDTKTNTIVETLYNFKKEYKSCVQAGSMGTGHCGLSVQYDEKSQFAVAIIDAKWGTQAIEIFKLKTLASGLEVQARTQGSFYVLENDLVNLLDKKLAKSSEYQANRDRLVSSYELKSVKALFSDKDSFETRIVFNAFSQVPKQEYSNEDQLAYRIVAKNKSSTLSLIKE
jgi:hypothetical protein